MNSQITLPLMETIKRSFLYVIKNAKDICKICSVFISLWILNIICGQPMLCNATDKECLTKLLPFSFALLLYLSCVIITVNLIRKIVLKQSYKWFHLYLGKCHFRYIVYNIIIALMVIIPSALILMIVKTTEAQNLSSLTVAFLGTAFISTLVGLSIFCCRLYLIYGGAAVNDTEMTLAKSYMLTEGNMLKICIGQIILTLPTVILTYLASSLYFAFPPTLITQNLFSLCLIFCYFFEASIKGAYYGHLYQYFTYMHKQ